MAGPAEAMALDEPMNRPAPMMPAMEIMETWREVRPCCRDTCDIVKTFGGTCLGRKSAVALPASSRARPLPQVFHSP
ncbi:hypothetical protein D9M71_786820 [compost metagenome]